MARFTSGTGLATPPLPRDNICQSASIESEPAMWQLIADTYHLLLVAFALGILAGWWHRPRGKA